MQFSNIMFKRLYLISSILFLFAFLPAFASNEVNYGDEWTIHSAFDNRVRKIIPTKEGKTFFFVHQRIFNSNSKGYTYDWPYYYGSPSGAIFFYDEKNPSAGLQDLGNLARPSGYDMRLVNYCPVNGNLVIVYNDGGLDVITPDFKKTYIDGIKKRIMSGASQVSAVNFDSKNGDIWLGTGAGFVHIDGTTLKIKEAPEWDEAVTAIAPVGDQIVCAIGDKVYSVSADLNFSLRKSYTQVASSSSTGTSLCVLPLSDNSFATINNTGRMYSYVLNDRSCSVRDLGATGITAKVENDVVNMFDHTVTPTAKGYYIGNASQACVLNRPEGDNSLPNVTNIALPSGGNIYNASYDLKSFWFFDTSRKFVNKSFDNGQWSTVCSVEPNTPLSSYDAAFHYSPENGFIMVSQHPELMTGYYSPYQNILISSYKDGQWKNLSPCYNPAQITLTNNTAQSQMNSRINSNRWPIETPVGSMIDPLNGNVLYAGSVMGGMVALYLDDPTKNPFIYTREGDASRSAFNAHDVLYYNSGWSDLAPVKPMGADSENVVWFQLDPVYIHDFIFYAIRPEGRQTQLATGDGYSAPQFDMVTIQIPSNKNGNSLWHNGCVLKHESNKNKIILFDKGGTDSGQAAIWVYDHKGTLEDTSDDTLQTIINYNVNGGSFTTANTRQILENPVTGDIILTSNYQTYIINLSDPIVNNTIKARYVMFKGENGLETIIRPSLRAFQITFDEYGRMWIPTQDHGLLGLSADGREIIAHYDATNSPIGGDEIHSVGWNPATKSLFVSANNVVAEVKVDLPTDNSGDVMNVPMAYPQSVTPEFAGVVAFHNIPAGVMLRVRNSKGMTIAELDAPTDGTTFWNLLDGDGHRVPSDNYSILDASGQNLISPISLPVIR